MATPPLILAPRSPRAASRLVAPLQNSRVAPAGHHPIKLLLAPLRKPYDADLA